MIWSPLFAVVKKMVLATLSAIVFLSFLYYLLQVCSRASEKKWYAEVSDNDGGIYTVKYAYGAENWIYLKVYRTGADELLAERTYQYIDGPKFIWIDNALIYDTNSNSYIYDGAVRLPPTKVDRWLARLP